MNKSSDGYSNCTTESPVLSVISAAAPNHRIVILMLAKDPSAFRSFHFVSFRVFRGQPLNDSLMLQNQFARISILEENTSGASARRFLGNVAFQQWAAATVVRKPIFWTSYRLWLV